MPGRPHVWGILAFLIPMGSGCWVTKYEWCSWLRQAGDSGDEPSTSDNGGIEACKTDTGTLTSLEEANQIKDQDGGTDGGTDGDSDRDGCGRISFDLRQYCVETNEPDNEAWCDNHGIRYYDSPCSKENATLCNIPVGGDYTAPAVAYFYWIEAEDFADECDHLGGTGQSTDTADLTMRWNGAG